MNIEKKINEINNELSVNYSIDNAYNKYIGHIKFEDLFTISNIYISAMRCASGFRNRHDTQNFLKSPWLNSYKLYKKIINGTFKPRYYKSRFIMERGKVREIKPPVFESKVVQKLLCDWLIRPLLEPEMINTSYASICKKGTDRMYKDILRAVNSCTDNKSLYIIMTDFKSYFSSIDNQMLKSMFQKRIKDFKIVKLIMMFSKEQGLSLGNELSQIPASFFPTEIDKTIKDKISTGHYFRYMDDTLFIVSNKSEAIKILKLYNKKANELNLSIKEPQIVSIGTNFVFCKERFLFDRKNNKYFRLCNKEIFSREKRKIKIFKTKLIDQSMTIEKINIQYKCVRNSIVHRANVKKVLIKLDKFYSVIIRH